MESPLSRDQKLGVFFMLFAFLLIFLWIPLDTDTGFIEKVRRQISIGDALAPTVAAAFLMVGGLGLLLFRAPETEVEEPLDLFAMRFAGLLFAVYFLCFLVMWGVGPLVVWVANGITGDALEYRLLRDTAPWKYLGFATGGTLAVMSSISMLEGRFSWRALFTGLVAVLAMIAIYDLPFDDLLLPPNGDM